ncbi:MAG: ABC transporter substrate-binding protein [Acidimicrobiales bacterium]
MTTPAMARSKPRLLAITSFAAALALAGCSGSPAAQKANTKNSTTGAAATNITVGIDIPFEPIWDYVEANASRYFAGKPYKVHFKVLDAATQVPAFGNGQLQVITTVPSFMPIIKKEYGINTTYFFPLARWTIGPQILVAKDSPYHTLADLKGKTVAMPPFAQRFGAEQAAILAATGEKIQNYFNLEQTPAAAQQLALGRVDAAFIEAPTTYPLLESGKFRAIYSVHDAFLKAFNDPAVMNGGYIARTDFIKNNPQFIKNLVAATENAWNQYQQNPAAVNRVASRVSGIPVAQLAVVGQVLDLLKMPAAERQITPRDVKTWTKLFPLLQQAGFTQETPSNVSSLFLTTAQLRHLGAKKR